MKKYILTGIALLVVHATASENPFDLKENFGQLEQDQELLLVELKKIADVKELAEEQKLAEEARELVNSEVETELPREDLPTSEIEDIVTSLDVKPDNAPKQVKEESKQAVVHKEMLVSSEENLSAMRQKALEASRTEAIKKEKLEKEALEKAVQSKEAELKKAKQEALKAAEAKKEAEKREVEAYERKRAERLARKAAQAAALEKEALAQKVAKEKVLPETTIKQAKKEKEIVSEQISKPLIEQKPTAVKKEAKVEAVKNNMVEETSNVKVIDLKREKEEAKAAADKAYEEAVKEMSQEERISS